MFSFKYFLTETKYKDYPEHPTDIEVKEINCYYYIYITSVVDRMSDELAQCYGLIRAMSVYIQLLERAKSS